MINIYHMPTNGVCHHPPVPSFSTLRIECERREFEARRQAVVDKILLAEERSV